MWLGLIEVLEKGEVLCMTLKNKTEEWGHVIIMEALVVF